MSNAVFQIHEGKNGKLYVNIRDTENGEIVFHNNQGYERLAGAHGGINWLVEKILHGDYHIVEISAEQPGKPIRADVPSTMQFGPDDENDEEIASDMNPE